MAIGFEAKISRLNLVAIVAGIVGLASLTFPWWGVDGPLGISFHWGLFSTATQGGIFGESLFDRLSQPLAQWSPAITSLALAAIVLAFLGSVVKRGIVLGLSLAIAFVASVLFVVDVNNAVSVACQGVSNCISGPSGSQGSMTWGFQTGFFVFVTSGVLLLVALILHRLPVSLSRKAEPATVKTG